MISVDEALEKVLREIRPLSVVERPLRESVGYTLAESVVSPLSLPPFDNSAMDGYAIRVSDVAKAEPAAPVRLRLVGEVAAGSVFEKPIGTGEAIRIMTGAQVPSTANAVVALEEARLRNGEVEICEPAAVGKHIRRKGEDVTSGQEILQRGTSIRVQHLGLLAGLGQTTVRVYRAPAVSLLTTGSELTEVGRPLAPGKIYNSNGLILRKLLEKIGVTVHDLGSEADEPEALRQAIQRGGETDLLLLSGGVSVGKYDHVKEVLQELGMKTVFWRVEMKPGKPVLFGGLGPKWVFGLPGNPISCVVCFLLFVRPAIQKMMGIRHPELPIVRARLLQQATKKDARRHYLTAHVEERGGERVVTPTPQQGSGMLLSLAQANGFIVMPEAQNTLEGGEVVDVLVFD